MVLGQAGYDSSARGLLEHSTGPRLEVSVAGLQHSSFSDLPALFPGALSVGKWRSSAQDIVVQRAYVRAFLDRHLQDRPSPLLLEPSPRFPRAKIEYRAAGFPDSAAGRQARWLIDASAKLPLSGAQLRRHFSAGFLAGGARAFFDALEDAGALRVPDMITAGPGGLSATVQGKAGPS